MTSKIIDHIKSAEYQKHLINLGGSAGQAQRFVARLVSYLKANPSLLSCVEQIQTEFLEKVSGLVQDDLSFGDEVHLSAYKLNAGGVVFSKNIMVGGLLKMIKREPGLKVYRPQIVKEGDEFDYQNVFENGRFQTRINHRPARRAAALTADTLECGYIIWEIQMPDGTIQSEAALISREDILISRDLSAEKRKSGKSPVWEKHFSAMCQKTVIRRVAKFLPLGAREAIRNQSDEEVQIDYENLSTHKSEPAAKAAPASAPTQAAGGQSAAASEKRGRGRPPKAAAQESAPPADGDDGLDDDDAPPPDAGATDRGGDVLNEDDLV